MLILYLAALIFGLGTFAVQLLFSSEASHHGGGPLELDSGDGHELVAAHALAGHAHAEHHVGAAGWASIFLSLRFYMFAAIGFGAVGAPVTGFGLSSPAWTLAVALATGLSVGVLASLAFRVIGRDTLSSGGGAAELVGQVGRVLLACEQGRQGKVRLNVRGQIVDYIATTDDARLGPGAVVIVQEVHAERVHVCAAPIELLPE